MVTILTNAKQTDVDTGLEVLEILEATSNLTAMKSSSHARSQNGSHEYFVGRSTKYSLIC